MSLRRLTISIADGDGAGDGSQEQARRNGQGWRSAQINSGPSNFKSLVSLSPVKLFK